MNPSNLPANTATHRKNHTIDRLHKWAQVLEITPFSFFNVVTEPGEVKMRDVNLEWVSLMTEGYDRVLALGGFASGALKRAGVEHFKLPHPSPRNRLLNSKEYETEILRECREYVKEGPRNGE